MADSRIIKFRAWDEKIEEMIFTGFHILGEVMAFGEIERHIVENLCGAESTLERWNDILLMQYTGLKDKDGKEIYEDDIFIAPHDFGPGGFQQKQAVVRFHECYGYQWQYWDVKNLIIIGNIYESPELLNEEHES